MVVGWGNMNGVVSSNIYRETQKPRYFTGHGMVLASDCYWHIHDGKVLMT